MNARSYFLSFSTCVIILNVAIGVGAIFLVERIVPAIDDILSENVYSVSSAVAMLEAVAPIEGEATSVQENQAVFWKNFEKAKENIILDSEKSVVANIELTAKDFWAGKVAVKKDLTSYIGELANINIQAMEVKDKEAQFLGLTGAWGLGFLLLFSIAIQLLLRSRILNSLIGPVEQLFLVVKDFNSGNTMRRFADHKSMLGDIKKTGALVNIILDQATTDRKSDTTIRNF